MDTLKVSKDISKDISEDISEDSQDSQIESNPELLLQISQFSFFHEDQTDDNNTTRSQYKIQIFGTDANSNKIYVQIDDFNPYFFIELPETWSLLKIKDFIEYLKQTKYLRGVADHFLSITQVKRYKFYGFTNKKQFKFYRLTFSSYTAFKKFSYELSKPLEIKHLSKYPIKINLYESNIEPLLRFIHTQNISPSGWIKISQYSKYNSLDAPTYNDININTSYKNIMPHVSLESAKLKIMVFDIECKSSDLGFPQPKRLGDPIIQIANTENIYNSSDCTYKYIATLNTCDPINDVIVESFKSEAELILGWAKNVKKRRPDFLAGYNNMGFDFNYIQERSKLLNINEHLLRILSRHKYQPATFVEQSLSSSALGENYLYYYNMPGIVQIDLLKTIRREYVLSNYKLDSVSANFIKDDITQINLINKFQTELKTKNTYGLEVSRYIKILVSDKITEDAYRDGQKFKIIALTKDSILINAQITDLDVKALSVSWGLAKDDISPQEIFAFQDQGPDKRAIIGDYCVQDCVLVNKLLEKLKVITNNIGMSNVCYVPLSYIFLRGQSIKILSFVSKKCRELNYLIKTVKKANNNNNNTNNKKKNNKDDFVAIQDDDNEGYEGATVFVPKTGVYKVPVPVFDYASLYPNSMIFRNLSHESFVDENSPPITKDILDKNYIKDVTFNNPDGSSTTCKFVKSKSGELGILPMILDELLSARKKTRELQKTETDKFKWQVLEGLQLAYKVTANSLYGQTGAPTSAIYLKAIAASTTATGREMLNCAKLFVECVVPILVKAAMSQNYNDYVNKMNLLFDKKIDELLGEVKINKLKNTFSESDPDDVLDTSKYKSFFTEREEESEQEEDEEENNKEKKEEIQEIKKVKTSDYYYLRVFQEKLKILTGEPRDNFIKKFHLVVNENLKDKLINPECIYGDTDSIFVNFKIRNINSEPEDLLTDNNSLKIAINISVLVGDLIKLVLPEPQNLQYEKTFHPWIILSKKRYVGNLYDHDPNKYKQKSMGIMLKRRDFAAIAKIVVAKIVNNILSSNDNNMALTLTKKTLKDLIYGKFPIDKFIISKTLKSTYKDRSRIVHAVLADRMAKRDPGNKPEPNDRIPYVYTEVNHEVLLQGDRVETPDYILKNNLKIDYVFYITNQIMKPSIQFLSHIVDNPAQIFKDIINRANNNKKGKRPIGYFFKQENNNNKKGELTLDLD